MQKPKIRVDNVLAEELQGECVVYDNSSKKAHHLNSTLSWVWRHCDGTRTVGDLATSMQRDLGGEDASAVLVTGLRQLAEANLLEPKSFDPNYFVREGPAVSRRSVIAGATIVAPVISSILAPTPAAAKSKPEKAPKVKGKKPKNEKEH